MEAEELVQQAKLADALNALQDQVRKNPADPKLRTFLFQLLAVLGQWDRAMTQLNVVADMDPGAIGTATLCRVLLNCEALRAAIFAGTRVPHIFGEPAEWVGWMVQANQLAAQEQWNASRELREQALEAAPAIPGTLNGEDFAWVADADSRLGPLLEAVIEGKYYWVPFSAIRSLKVNEPEDLRDLVWAPATFLWTNGGNAVGFIPVRYPGTESASDDALRLGRRTEWVERQGDLYVGIGQRMLATDQAECALLEVRELLLNHPDAPPAEGPSEGEAPAQETADDA